MVDTVVSQDQTAVQRRVLLVILDGFGFNLQTEATILDKTVQRLPPEARQPFLQIAEAAWRQTAPEIPPPAPEALLQLVLAPVFATIGLQQAFASFPWETLSVAYHKAREQLRSIPHGSSNLLEHASNLITEEALASRYTVWYARSPYINLLRNSFPTIPTQAAGLAAGYEDVIPPVQGNSETGHQQIGNFIVAAQTPLEISTEIADGRFFRNPALLDCFEQVQKRHGSLNICFLLSGEYGNDGRVHSAWNHLEALLEAAFVQAKIPPSRVRIEAITDGRDSPAHSSVKRVGDQYGFLYKLKALLARHGAEESLAWVVGRSIAMDRDYEESRSKQDYDLIVNGLGRQVRDVDAAIQAVKELHDAGHTDTNIPPLVVGSPRKIEANDVFLDLNFRADRQRAKIAMLLGARAFLEQEAGKKGRRWQLGWLNPLPGLSVYCLSEYHPDFEAKYGAKILYPIRPQAHNLFAILPEQSDAQNFPFSYLLAAESTKALHVGYFIRGRRELPVVPTEEERRIIPSYGAEYGVATDDDYYKTPQMRAFSLSEVVVEALSTRSHDLIAINLANTDMIGHLLPKRFEAADQSITTVDLVLETIVPTAQRNGYDVVITADHGNIEDDDSSHTANEVLTTFVSPDRRLALRIDPRERARLFDLPWSIVEIMGLNDRILPHIPPIPEKIRDQGLVGRSLVRVVPAAGVVTGSAAGTGAAKT